MSVDLTRLTLSEAAGQIARQDLSPVDLVQACLERIGQLDPVLNSFITVTGDSALEQARRLEAELKGGHHLGLLHGIPLGLKDLYHTRGVLTTAATQAFASFVPEDDAAAVEKLAAAGAIFLGKLNLHEIALGVTNETSYFGPVDNPRKAGYISGGSSGGSAAAVAAGLCLGALGSDTGGSIRIPASLCGVVGIKPTYGRVSLRGVIPLSWNLDHAGPLARTVRDAAILLQAIAGYDPRDPASADVPVEDYLADLESGVRGWRVALAVGEFFEQADPEVLTAVQAAAQVFTTLGAQVVEVEPPDALRAARANGLIVVSDAAVYHRERLAANPDGFGPDVRRRLQDGAGTQVPDYILARRTQVELRRRLEDFFLDYDLLLTPATPMAAPRRGSADGVEHARQLTRFTAPFNLTGLPALSLPCGVTREALPIGLQIISRPWAEAAVLRGARSFEANAGGRDWTGA